MRYDDPVPAHVILDLLARSDALAVAASQAIVAGDDALLSALLDDRDAVIGAVISAWHCTANTSPSVGQMALLSQATGASVAAGLATHAAAVRARDQIVAELSALEARQQASQEYRTDTPHGSLDVVL